MPRRLHKTTIDYLIIAVSPALIMALVGSLVFFLIEVFYRGNFQGRLQYIFALFVIGAVLIARISIEDGRERAAFFALPLGVAVLLAINKFVVFQGGLGPLTFLINLGLIALVWWSADKLTWDCTLIDEQEEDSGEGLLETAGLDSSGKAALEKEIAPASEYEAAASKDGRPKSWWERFVERRRRPHAPGVWVVYFSLAAVALFGLGQLFIPSDDMAARRHAFQLLFVYTASGLCLLVTTSFLGLRRYLRQRRMEMPTAMAGLWLIFGFAMVAVVMFSAMLIPRPNAEYAVSETPFRIGSPDQKSSRFGTGIEEVEEDVDWARGKPSDEPSDRTVDSESGKEKTQAADDGQSKNGESDKKQSGKNGEDSADSSSKKTKDKPDSPRQNDDNPPKSDNVAKPESETSDGEKSNSADASQTKRRSDQNSPSNPPRSWTPPKFDGERIAGIVKWIVYGVLLAAIAYAIWKNRSQLAGAWRDFWRRLLEFWHGLFGGRRDKAGDLQENETSTVEARRFRDFPNPFTSGAAGKWPPEELVRYTFDALEAWAAERGCARPSEQTPFEFVRRLTAAVPAIKDDAWLLADLYCQAAYADNRLPRASMSRLSSLWSKLCSPENLG